MTNRWKGIYVAMSATVMTAIAMGIAIDHGLSTKVALLTTRETTALNVVLLVLASLPVTLMFGSLLGPLRTPELGPKMRRGVFAMIAVLFVCTCIPLWPDLAIYASPIAALHALVLARWTELRPTLPRAIALCAK